MRHRLQHKLFDRKKRSKSRSPSTFIKQKLHSKSTYFYRWGSKIKNINLSRLSYAVPSVCSLALLIGGIVILNPINNSQAYATYTVEAGDGDTGTTGSETTPTTPSITLTLQDNPKLSESAIQNAMSFISNTFTVVADNLTGGYHISVKSNNDSSNLVRYDNDVPDYTAVLTGVGKEVPTTSFPDNTWGYAISTDTNAAEGGLSYDSLPTSSSAVMPKYYTEKVTETKSFKLAFAARFGSTLPAGHYKADVILSAVAGPATVTGSFGGVTFMQDLTAQECGATDLGYTRQLTDRRDNKAYWVSKLKDGNCWMTQNLDFNPGSTIQRVNITDWPKTTEQAIYAEPGDYVNTTPHKAIACDSTDGLDICPNWKSVSGKSPSTSPNLTPILDGNYYNAHYHIGNYYNYYAANIGQTIADQSTSSICPTNWVLPFAGPGYDDSKGSFNYMLSLYGVNAEATSVNGGYDIRLDPLYFLYGGGVNEAGLMNAGEYGAYWSRSTTEDSTKHLYLLLNNNLVTAAQAMPKTTSIGLSVRCLLKGV